MNTFEPQPASFYTRKLIQHIPQEAYAPATYKLLPMFLHAGLFMTFLSFIYITNSLLITVGFSIMMGICIACLFLYSHELSHGTIIKKEPYLYGLQNFFWAFSGIPPTVWKRVHNLSHHTHMNTYDDPDRKTFKSESNTITYLYNLFIYPNRKLRYALTIGFAMIFYSTKHIMAVFYSSDSKPSIVTFRPKYTKREQKKVVLELTYIILFWGTIWALLGIVQGLLVSILCWTTYSASVIILIITQHQRDPVFQKIADPLLTTTSVRIPKWLDRIIDWHSFHVEHHLFPGINFDYYPQLSSEIKKQFPEKYDQLPLIQALREVFEEDVLIDDPLT